MMDLTRNICGLCCTVHSRSMLSWIGGENDGMSIFISVFLRLAGNTNNGVLVCERCRDKLLEFVKFWSSCRNNLTRLRDIQEEQQKPDSTCHPMMKEDEDMLQISVTDETHVTDPHNYSDNTVTITKLEKLEPWEERVQKYNYQKPAMEIIESNNNSYPSLPIPQTCGLDLTSRNMEDSKNVEKIKEFKNFNTGLTIELQEYSMNSVSPLPSDLTNEAPIIAPLDKEDDRYDGEVQSLVAMTSEERRRHRNREASRRYREKARSDPELLKKMRQQ